MTHAGNRDGGGQRDQQEKDKMMKGEKDQKQQSTVGMPQWNFSMVI